VPKNLKRYYGAGDLHFVTSSCYHRQPWLASARRRDLFLTILEQVRQRYRFVVVGYVVMPEHFHLLISEPQRGTPSTVIQALKLGWARRILARTRLRNRLQASLWENRPPSHIWQRRFYDFNVWSERKRIEKLRYMHPQSGEAWIGPGARSMALEQLPVLCLRRNRSSAGECIAGSADEGWGVITRQVMPLPSPHFSHKPREIDWIRAKARSETGSLRLRTKASGKEGAFA
jgi:putative transposase